MTGANGKRPEPELFDLDAASEAAAKEASAVPFTFTYKGTRYEVPPATDWPLEAQRLIGTGDIEDAMPMLLGKGTYDQLVTAGLTLGELQVLFDAIGKHAGVADLPNSPVRALPASTPT